MPDSAPGPDLAGLWDFSDPTASEGRFRAALAAAEPQEAAVLWSQVARAQGLQGRLDDGAATLEAIAPELVATDPEVATRVALERGRLLRDAGESAAALRQFQDAARRAASAGLDALQIDALHMLALVQPAAQARATTDRALTLARTSADPVAQRWQASLLNNLGMSHADAGEWEQALATFEAALALRRRQGAVEQERVARWMVAWALRELGRTGEALILQRALHAEHTAAGTDDPYVRSELALLEAELGPAAGHGQIDVSG